MSDQRVSDDLIHYPDLVSTLDTGRAGWRVIEQLVAGVVVVGLGLRVFIFSAVTPGTAMSALLTPVLFINLRRYRWAVAFVASALCACVSGWVLSALARPHYLVSSGNRLFWLTLILGLVFAVGAVAWARTVLPRSMIGLLYGLGMLGSALVSPDLHGDNPWKFALAVPVAVILLSLAGLSRARWLELAVLAVLGLASIIFDSRSYMATFLLAAVLVLWQFRPQNWSRRASAARTAFLMAASGAGVYILGSNLLVGGALGEQAQQRSIDQIRTAGNLILGGRPELAATLRLFAAHPFGFGFGVILGITEVGMAKQAMVDIHYNAADGYVETFMLGNGIELHSVIGDLWASCGLAGILLVVMIAALTGYGLAHFVALARCSALVLFGACWTLWNLLFSPLYSSIPSMSLLLGLVLVVKKDKSSSMAEPGGPDESATGQRDGE